MALDPQLLDILACPDTHHAPLTYDAGAQTLTCTECGRVFEVRDDIPVLLLDEITADLDADTERMVLEAIRAASEGRTVLSISHRVYTSLGGKMIHV